MSKADLICGNHIWCPHGGLEGGKLSMSKAFKIRWQLSGSSLTSLTRFRFGEVELSFQELDMKIVAFNTVLKLGS